MKTNFKKTLSVLLAILMVASVFSVTAFAATYYITYMPGEGVDAEPIVDEMTGSSIKIRGVTFERAGFTQVGWSTTEGGSITNTFNQTYRKKANLTLYPVWKGAEYTLTYDPGAYGVGAKKDITTEAGKVVGLEGAIFTREGYVQLGWSLTDGGELKYELNANSDAITGNLTLYPYWAQIYNVTFAPGAYGEGEEITISVESGETFTSKDAIFTRDGYLQIGWATEDGGRLIYELNQNFIPVEEDLVLYPVWNKVIYSIDVDTDSIFFGNVCEDYVVEDVQSFTVTNNGNTPITLNISFAENFYMSYGEPVVIAAGASYTVEVLPMEDLGFGNYEETLTITVDGVPSVSKTVALRFYVSEHVFGEYKSCNDATYTEDGHKEADCVKGCGTKDIIDDLNSKKVYSADNNDAVGLAESYIHHRTVRFTAYGSGMDAIDENEVGKRFRPVSWYVSDEFNGEFEEGYEVTFTHTIFGNYTLTINYVEESFDTVAGEWVATGETDTKTFEYTVGTTAEEEQEIVRPNTILNIIFGLFQELLKLLGLA